MSWTKYKTILFSFADYITWSREEFSVKGGDNSFTFVVRLHTSKTHAFTHPDTRTQNTRRHHAAVRTEQTVEITLRYVRWEIANVEIRRIQLLQLKTYSK